MKCDDKNKHATEREALDHLAWARKQPGGHGLRHLRVYRCPVLGANHWHIGRSHRSEREATGPILSAAKLRRKVQAVGAQIAAEDRRIIAEENRRAQEKARHTAELAAQAKDNADTLAWIAEMIDRALGVAK